ncbi:MAG: elongation factor 1-beta, partial [Candidatus Bathyarchaeia archaeon]
MAEILASIRILPADAQVDLENLKSEIQQSVPSNVKVHKLQEEPIAFGLIALIAHVTMPEKEEGVMSRLEEV